MVIPWVPIFPPLPPPTPMPPLFAQFLNEHILCLLCHNSNWRIQAFQKVQCSVDIVHCLVRRHLCCVFMIFWVTAYLIIHFWNSTRTLKQIFCWLFQNNAETICQYWCFGVRTISAIKQVSLKSCIFTHLVWSMVCSIWYTTTAIPIVLPSSYTIQCIILHTCRQQKWNQRWFS